MLYTRYASAAAFSEEVTDILMEREIQNNLFFMNIDGGKARADTSNMVMATVKDDSGAVLLTAVRTRPFPLLIYLTDNIPDDEALELLAASLVREGEVIDIVMSEKTLAEKFCALYCGLSGKTYQLNENLVLYTLQSVSPAPLPGGSFRAAREEDLFYLPYWLADFIPACHQGDYNLNGGYMTARRTMSDDRLYIWEDGVPVSTASCVRRTPNCSYVGQVYTPPHLRGKGYCTACVSSLTQLLLNSGREYCALYADCANPFSNKVYRKIGYQEFFRYDQYRIK